MTDRVKVALHSRTGAKPHTYDPDLPLPGYCRCGLLRRNALHDDEAITAYRAELAARQDRLHEAQAEHHRRLGEH